MTELLEGANVGHIESVPELTSHFGVPTVLAQKKTSITSTCTPPSAAISRDVYC
jgi:hypothetical protein